MKHFDDSTKKLIKNVAALCVSALVLIAATVAWFAQGDSAAIDQISINTESIRSTDYYAVSATGVLQNVTTVGAGTSSEHKELVIHDSTNTSVTVTLQNQVESNSWTKTSAWGISSLYPGVYRAYKMQENANGAKPSFHMGVACSNDDANHTALKSTYLEARAYTTSQTQNGDEIVTSYTEVGTPICDSLYNLLVVVNPQTGTSSVGTAIDRVLYNTEVNGGFIVVFRIGVPGTDVSSTHDTLRTLGASIALSSVSASTASS